MADVEDVAASILPRLTAADTAFHNGDPAPRKVLWSTNDPVTLFGAAVSATGWADISATFDVISSRFSDCESYEYEVISAAASGDLACIVGFEHTTASVGGDPAVTYTLRVTTILRREDGQWKIFYRHGDALADGARAMSRLVDDPGHA